MTPAAGPGMACSLPPRKRSAAPVAATPGAAAAATPTGGLTEADAADALGRRMSSRPVVPPKTYSDGNFVRNVPGELGAAPAAIREGCGPLQGFAPYMDEVPVTAAKRKRDVPPPSAAPRTAGRGSRLAPGPDPDRPSRRPTAPVEVPPGGGTSGEERSDGLTTTPATAVRATPSQSRPRAGPTSGAENAATAPPVRILKVLLMYLGVSDIFSLSRDHAMLVQYCTCQ